MKIRQKFFQIIQTLPEDSLQTGLTIFYGISAALAAVAFLLLTNHVFSFLFLRHANDSVPVFLIHSFVVIMSTSLVVGLLLHFFSRDAAGSGIPQLKAAYWKDLGYVPWKPVWVKFVAGIISIGGGSSLGREGPSVYVGGGVASQLAGLTGQPKQKRRAATVVGAAAALAAAFNTPLAAITFVMEELIGTMNNRYLGKVVLAAVIGAFTVHAIVGGQPAFSLPTIKPVPWPVYVLVPLVAALSAGLGVIFQRTSLSWRTRIRLIHRIPNWLKPCIGGLITWILGSVVFIAVHRIGVYGLGYQDLTAALEGSLAWKAALLLVGAKLIATIACYSWGGSGGIFAPTLFLGGLTGASIAGLAGLWMPMAPDSVTLLAAAGMSACFGTVVRAPLTALLIVFEMTHQFEIIPALMLAMIVSQAIARFSGSHNFYDALLIQDGHELIHIKPPADMNAWRNLPVSSIANRSPIVLRDLSLDTIQKSMNQWPYACFPVMENGLLKGGLTRHEGLISLKENRPPQLILLVTCSHDDLLHDVVDKMVQTSAPLAVVMTPETNKIHGVMTLHDLLRTQASLTE